MGCTVWSPFPENTDYFGKPDQQVMLNYRVRDLETLVNILREEGVAIVDNVENYEGIGKFVHILDPEGNKIELRGPAEERD